MFIGLKYIDLNKNTCVLSSVVTEIMMREVLKNESCYTLLIFKYILKKEEIIDSIVLMPVLNV
jgi:hypothetical protein